MVRYHIRRSRAPPNRERRDLVPDLAAAPGTPGQAAGARPQWSMGHPVAVARRRSKPTCVRRGTAGRVIVLRRGTWSAWDGEERRHVNRARTVVPRTRRRPQRGGRASPASLANAVAPRILMDAGNGLKNIHVTTTAGNMAQSIANEVRVHFAHGFDHIWESPSRAARHLAAPRRFNSIATMRDCAFGASEPGTARRRVILLADPVRANAYRHSRQGNPPLSPRRQPSTLAPAAQARICVSEPRPRACHGAPRRTSPRAACVDRDMDHRGAHALIAARALFTIAADGNDAAICGHIDAYADTQRCAATSSSAIGGCRGVATSSRNRTRIWPTLIPRHRPASDRAYAIWRRHYGWYALAALLPNRAGEVAYLCANFRRIRSFGSNRSLAIHVDHRFPWHR